jgi:hypothetical protein
MNEEAAIEELHWVLVEGPEPADAEFLGRWLLAAAEADRAFEELLKQNSSLKEQIGFLYLVSFSAEATSSVELLMKNRCCFSVDLWELFGKDFAVMAEIGFFHRTGNRYQMSVPEDISGSTIEAALLRLAATKDEQEFLHPEQIITCLSKHEIESWQSRLERLPWTQRVADRNFLMSEVAPKD